MEQTGVFAHPPRPWFSLGSICPAYPFSKGVPQGKPGPLPLGVRLLPDCDAPCCDTGCAVVSEGKRACRVVPGGHRGPCLPLPFDRRAPWLTWGLSHLRWPHLLPVPLAGGQPSQASQLLCTLQTLGNFGRAAATRAGLCFSYPGLAHSLWPFSSGEASMPVTTRQTLAFKSREPCLPWSPPPRLAAQGRAQGLARFQPC